MKRTLIALGALALLAGVALADTPNPTTVVFHERIFNDCPTSTLTTFNNYPAEVWIDDQNLDCYGYANLHTWLLSENGTDAAVFNNNSEFSLAADLVINGTGDGEAGLIINPWWSQSDGRINVRSTDGEVAVFGGRLPFYSFTANNGVVYQKGTSIHLEVEYHPNDLTEQNPATIEYRVTYNGNDYTSGILPFDEGNESEGYGTWGILNDARVGGHLQAFLGQGNAVGVRATWTNIVYENLEPPTAVEPTSWGNVKALFR